MCVLVSAYDSRSEKVEEIRHRLMEDLTNRFEVFSPYQRIVALGDLNTKVGEVPT